MRFKNLISLEPKNSFILKENIVVFMYVFMTKYMTFQKGQRFIQTQYFSGCLFLII